MNGSTKYFSALLLSSILLVGCATKVPLTQEPVVQEGASNTAKTPASPSSSNTPSNPSAPAQANTTSSSAAAIDREIKAGTVIIHFDFDSYVVKPEFQAVLEAQAKLLKSNRPAKISLAGHTDDIGGREYNLALGQKRADAVKRALAILGVSEAQMESVSFGKEKPMSNGLDEESRAKNRRVEISAP